MTSVLKRISSFHQELAKRIARGDKNSEILSTMRISPSRLSVLKSNPLFQNLVSEYQSQFDDTFYRAHKELENGSVQVARELINCATNPTIPPKDRIQAGFGVLDRIGLAKGQGVKPTKSGGQEVVFEQMLRVVKRQMEGPQEPESEEFTQALKQLADLGEDPIQEGEYDEEVG